MDLNTVESIVPARTRQDLTVLSASVRPLAGGSVLFSEQNPALTGLVDLLAFGWEPLIVSPEGLEIAATCTLAELSRIPPVPGWTAHPLFFQCCTALFGSFKIWNVATVGGNLCASLAAGPMTSLAAALDASVLVWRRDGADDYIPAAEFVTDNGANVLSPGDIVRSIFIPTATLSSTTAFRKIALSPLGRSGSVVIARDDPDGSFVLTVTAATTRPEVLRFAQLPDKDSLEHELSRIGTWFADAHGAADWRRGVTSLLAVEVRDELQASARGRWS